MADLEPTDAGDLVLLARARLEAYLRVLGFAGAAGGEPLRPPVAALSDAQLAILFGARRTEQLVRPFEREVLQCP